MHRNYTYSREGITYGLLPTTDLNGTCVSTEYAIGGRARVHRKNIYTQEEEILTQATQIYNGLGSIVFIEYGKNGHLHIILL